MTRSLLIVAFLLSFLCCASEPPSPEVSSSEPPVDMAAVKQAIDTVRANELSAFTGGDVDSFERLFTADCHIIPPDEQAVSGRDNGRQWLENMTNQFTISGEYTGSEIELIDDHVVERYTAVLGLTPKTGGEKAEAQVQGIHIYAKQNDGSWQIAYDIWNYASPAATSQ